MELSILLDAVKEWAMEEETVLSVLLFGSHANNRARADSDIDLMLITSDPKRYIIGTFYNGFGQVSRCQKEDWGAVKAVRVFYDNGYEVEFAITSPELMKLPFDQGTHDALAGGYRVILDKENALEGLMRDTIL